MATYLHLGKHIVNADHIVDVEHIAATPELTQWDPEMRHDRLVKAEPVKVRLTLTAVELESIDYYGEGPGRAAASASQTITLRGALAEKLWAWFENRADIVNLEQVTP